MCADPAALARAQLWQAQIEVLACNPGLVRIKLAYSHVVAVALASVMPWMHPIEPTATRP